MSQGPLTRAERKRNLERQKTLGMRAAYEAGKPGGEPAKELVKRGKTDAVYTLRPTKRGNER